MKEWNEEMVSFGYAFVLNVDRVRKQLTEKEMTELSPKESVWVCIQPAKDIYKMAQKEGLSIIELINKLTKEVESANKSGS